MARKRCLGNVPLSTAYGSPTDRPDASFRQTFFVRRFRGGMLSAEQLNSTFVLELLALKVFALQSQVLALYQDETMALSRFSVFTSRLSAATQ